MKRELWRPDRQQLKRRTDALMLERMGEDWRTFFDPSEERYSLKAMVLWGDSAEPADENHRFEETASPDFCCSFLMSAREWGQTGSEQNEVWGGTTTEALYRDAWGTALMDAGRELLKAEGEKRYSHNISSIVNKRYRWKCNAPGLGEIPLEAMKELYNELHGWEMGIEINEACVLIPDKSFGGWFRWEGVADEERIGENVICRPGAGCPFCILRGTKQCKQYRRGFEAPDLTKGEIQLVQDVLWDTSVKDDASGDCDMSGEMPQYGVAFDIGTTTVAAMLWEMPGDRIRQNSTGITPLASAAIQNPQRIHGVDVISRIDYAQGNPERIREMQKLIVETMGELIDTLVTQLRAQRSGSGEQPIEISRISAVGNTTMLHFLFGEDPSGLAKAPFTGKELPLEIEAKLLGLADVKLRTLPVMGGHLGADAAAVLLALRLPEETMPALVMDIGTNGELLMTDGQGRLWGCSTAAGPAFEGASVSPGSKLIDAAKAMLDQGWMDRDGLVNRPGLLNQNDIRQLQMAKGAISAGAEILAAKLVAAESITRIYLAGTFGNHIRPESARGIGLIPGEAEVISCGNAAGVGASLILLSDREWEQGIAWAKRVRHVELAEEPEFAEAFVRNMEFQ